MKDQYDIVSWKGVSSECLETSGACFSCHNIWRRVPQASSGQDPGMLNLLECIEYFCTMRNCPTWDVSHCHAPMEQYWKEQNACRKGRGCGAADEVRLLSFLSTVVWAWSWACWGATNKAKAGGVSGNRGKRDEANVHYRCSKQGEINETSVKVRAEGDVEKR